MKIVYFNNLGEALACCRFLAKNGFAHARRKISTINKWCVIMDHRAYMYWADFGLLMYESK